MSAKTTIEWTATVHPDGTESISNEDAVYAMVAAGMLRIDEDGRVWRTGFRRHGQVYPCAERRAENQTGRGYLQVRVLIDGHRYHTSAHRLVWRHFRGPIPPGLVINHIDGQKAHNRIDNLEVVTQSENVRHAYRLGLIDEYGERNPAAKLTDRQVTAIRLAYARGNVTQQQLADKYGTAHQTVSKIVRGERRSRQLGPIRPEDNRHIASRRDPITGRFIPGRFPGRPTGDPDLDGCKEFPEVMA